MAEEALEISDRNRYLDYMLKTGKPLSRSNKYLRDPKVRDNLIVRHAAASARIEGVKRAGPRAARLIKVSRSPR